MDTIKLLLLDKVYGLSLTPITVLQDSDIHLEEVQSPDHQNTDSFLLRSTSSAIPFLPSTIHEVQDNSDLVHRLQDLLLESLFPLLLTTKGLNLSRLM